MAQIVLFSIDHDIWARLAACLLLLQVLNPEGCLMLNGDHPEEVSSSVQRHRSIEVSMYERKYTGNDLLFAHP